jgi:hypothetical protein
MLTASLDNILWLSSALTEAVVIVLLIYKKFWRIFPVFCLFCAWALFSDLGFYVILHFFQVSYLTNYFVFTVVDSVLQFSVLVELAWSVLRPIRASLPRGALIAIGFLIIAIGAVIWPFSGIHQISSLSTEMRYLVRMLQTFSILRILFFLALAGCSQLLSIGWRDREMQIATGLGFYSMVSLAVQMMDSHLALGPMYRRLDQVVVASSVGSSLYWVYCFAQKEAERREFTPQMEHFLLALAGNARSTLIALTGVTGTKTRKLD